MYALQSKANKTVQINKKVIKIGRHLTNDVVVGHLRVSRFHSEIIEDNGKIYLKDKKTINGTFIEKHRLLPEREILLKVGDTIGIGCKAHEEDVCTFQIITGNTEIGDDVSSSTHEHFEQNHLPQERIVEDNIAEPSSTSDVKIRMSPLPDEPLKPVSFSTLNSNISSVPSTTVCESSNKNVCTSKPYELAATPFCNVNTIATEKTKMSNSKTIQKSSYPIESSNHRTAETSVKTVFVNTDKLDSKPKLKISFCPSVRNKVDGSGDSNKVQPEDRNVNKTAQNFTSKPNVPQLSQNLNQSTISGESLSFGHPNDVIDISDSEESNPTTNSKISKVTIGSKTGALVNGDVINLVNDSEDELSKKACNSEASSRKKSNAPVENIGIINLLLDLEDDVSEEISSSKESRSRTDFKISDIQVDQNEVIDLLNDSYEKQSEKLHNSATKDANSLVLCNTNEKLTGCAAVDEPVPSLASSEVNEPNLLANLQCNKAITILPVNDLSKKISNLSSITVSRSSIDCNNTQIDKRDTIFNSTSKTSSFKSTLSNIPIIISKVEPPKKVVSETERTFAVVNVTKLAKELRRTRHSKHVNSVCTASKMNSSNRICTNVMPNYCNQSNVSSAQNSVIDHTNNEIKVEVEDSSTPEEIERELVIDPDLQTVINKSEKETLPPRTEEKKIKEPVPKKIEEKLEKESVSQRINQKFVKESAERSFEEILAHELARQKRKKKPDEESRSHKVKEKFDNVSVTQKTKETSRMEPHAHKTKERSEKEPVFHNKTKDRSHKEIFPIRIKEKSSKEFIRHTHKEKSVKTPTDHKIKENSDREPVLHKIKDSHDTEIAEKNIADLNINMQSNQDVLADIVPPAPKIPPLNFDINSAAPTPPITDPSGEFKVPSPYVQRPTNSKAGRRSKNIPFERASDVKENEISTISNSPLLRKNDSARTSKFNISTIDLSSEGVTNVNQNEVFFISDSQLHSVNESTSTTKLNISTIDLSMSDDEDDIKPSINPNYSNLDEIITLDSDEEDFPSSQLNATQLDDVPDFASTFEMIYDGSGEAIKEEEPEILHCNENTWFDDDSLTVNDLVEGKHAMKANDPVPDLSTDGESNMDYYEPTNDPSPSDLSAKEQKTVMTTELMNKYHIKECVVKLISIEDARNLHNRTKKRKSKDNLPEINAKKKLHVDELEVLNREHAEFAQGVTLKKKIKSNKNQLLRQIKKDNYKINNINKSKRQSISQIQHKKIIKQQRKEKLKQIVRPAVENLGSKIIHRSEAKPIVKVTNKNRSLHLIESIVGQDYVKKKDKFEEIVPTVKDVDIPGAPTEPEIPLLEVHTKMFESTNVQEQPSTSKEDNNFGHPSARDDVERLLKMYCTTPITETPSTNNPVIIDKPPAKNGAPAVPQNETKTNVVKIIKPKNTTNDCGIDEIDKLLDKATNNAVIIDKPPAENGAPVLAQKETKTNVVKKIKPKNTTNDCGIDEIDKLLDEAMESNNQNPDKADDMQFDQTETLEKKLPRILSSTKISDRKENRVMKSNLKVNHSVYGQTTARQRYKKIVKFQDKKNDYKFIESDYGERRNNGIFAPAFKLNENLIRESWLEFEAAMTKVCSWNVRWLGEQQKCVELPPLYPECKEVNHLDLIGQYKEHVKSLMFRSLWRSMFQTWNKPNNDILPHTQFMADTSTSLYSLRIEKVDTVNSDKQLWTVVASRVLSAFEKGDEISNGQIVIINFYVRTKPNENPKKTIMFAYIANIFKVPIPNNSDGCSIQKVVFKIKSKPFTIVMGEIKMKVLNYLKSLLRPFQALAMVLRSPLTCLIIDPEPKFPIIEYFKDSDDYICDKFLDASQRKAVISCLNCIHNNYPSISLVDGTPGTGKSQVVVSLIHQIFAVNRQSFPDDLKILIVCTSDQSADDLSYRLEGLNKKQNFLNFLRYGNCKGVHHLMKNCTLDKKIQDLIQKDNGEHLINLEEEKNNLRARIHSFRLVLDSPSATQEKIADAKYKLSTHEKELHDMVSENSKVIEQLKSQAAKEVAVENADVIITTTNICWSSGFENDFIPTHSNKGDVHKFTVCIFEDANHITEIGMLIPVMLMVRSLIIVGDRMNQLNVPAEKSPFSRLVKTFETNNLTGAITKLENQHRMHPSIMEWIDQNFQLNCQYKAIPAGIKQKVTPFYVVNLILSNENNMTILHEDQAIACIRLIVKIDEHYDPRGKFGLIVAHDAQRDCIRNLLNSGAYGYGSLNKTRKIQVETINLFNGRERDMVLLCLPYNINQYEKWLYVAMSRARDCLIICGDFSRITPRDSLNSLVRFAKYRNLYTSWSPMSDESIPTSAMLTK